MLDTLSCSDAVNTMTKIAGAAGISTREMATSLRDWFINNPQSVRPIVDISDNGLCCCDRLEAGVITAQMPYDIKPHRIRCDYCGVVSEKDYGTCEHCGAPLPL
jgi:hypothetical protein